MSFRFVANRYMPYVYRHFRWTGDSSAEHWVASLTHEDSQRRIAEVSRNGVDGPIYVQIEQPKAYADFLAHARRVHPLAVSEAEAEVTALDSLRLLAYADRRIGLSAKRGVVYGLTDEPDDEFHVCAGAGATVAAIGALRLRYGERLRLYAGPMPLLPTVTAA